MGDAGLARDEGEVRVRVNGTSVDSCLATFRYRRHAWCVYIGGRT
jgi:hypothetical protein